MAYTIRELTIGEILDQAIQVLKNRFGLLLGIVGCAYLPLTLLAALIQAAYVPTMSMDPTGQEMLVAQQGMEGMIFLIPVGLVQTLIVLPITYGAIIHAISKEYLQEPTSVGDSLRAGVSRAIPLIWTMILYYLAVFGGMLLCIIPGILFALWFALSPQVVVLEQHSGVSALKRSRALIRANVGKVLVLGLILFIISFLVGLGLAVVPSAYVQALVNAFVQVVLFIFGTAASVVLYFSCRSQHEGFDLARLAEAVRAEESSGRVAMES